MTFKELIKMEQFIGSVFEAFEDLYHKDLSHGIDHHKDVVNTLLEIGKIDNSNFEEFKLAIFCAAIHDIVDYKYEFDEAEVKKRISLFGYEEAWEIITNMSWSKRAFNKVRPELVKIRDLCMYADWINSLILERCIEYSKVKFGEKWIPEFIKTYYNKLILMIHDIPKEYYYLAWPMHLKLMEDFERLDFKNI